MEVGKPVNVSKANAVGKTRVLLNDGTEISITVVEIVNAHATSKLGNHKPSKPFYRRGRWE